MTTHSPAPYIFYDFETSSSDLLGQIFTYAFIITDHTLAIVDTWTGCIKPNRTQIAEVGAILTNHLNIDVLTQTGATEYDTAKELYAKLTSLIQTHGHATLIGFNSNKFDLQFLRNLLIRYGFNPYFKGKLQNLDILQWVEHLAFEHPDTYPWTLATTDSLAPYYSFTLENTATAFHLLTTAQTHDAYDDVVLLIELVKVLQTTFGQLIGQFAPIHLPAGVYKNDHFILGKQKVRQFNAHPDDELTHFVYRYWIGLDLQKKSKLMLDLDAFDQLPEGATTDQLLTCMKYINDNKHYFHLHPLTHHEEQYYGPIIEKASYTTEIKTITLEKYFKLTEKDWDIEYQIHQLGFERIDTLHDAIAQLASDPTRYDAIIKRIWTGSKDPKDKYLVQLFNRAYLNIHPAPNPVHLARYMAPRYLTGQMLRDTTHFQPLPQKIEELTILLASGTLSEENHQNLEALKRDMVVKLG
jgi:DNA polymerase III epsilon subunit-like protein